MLQTETVRSLQLCMAMLVLIGCSSHDTVASPDAEPEVAATASPTPTPVTGPTSSLVPPAEPSAVAVPRAEATPTAAPAPPAFEPPAVSSPFLADVAVVDLAPVDYSTVFATDSVPFADFPTMHPVPGPPTDSGLLWTAVLPEGGPSTCSGQARTALRLVDPDTGAILSVPSDGELPTDVTWIEAGPEGNVILGSTCGDQITITLATMTTDGSLNDIRRVNLQATTSVLGHRKWVWGDSDGLGPGLYLRIAQRDVRPQASSEWRHLWIHTETGLIVSDEPGREFAAGAGHLDEERRFTVGFDQNAIVIQEGVAVAAMSPYPNSGEVLVAGRFGAGIQRMFYEQFPSRPVNPRPAPPDRASRFELLVDEPVIDAAWAPDGSTWAASGSAGTWVDGRRVHDAAGTLHFSRDGRTLLVVGTEGWHRIVFAPGTANSNEVTRHSQLDSGGLGPIRIGMLVSELSEVLGRDLTIEALGDIDRIGECIWVEDLNIRGVSLLGSSTGDGDGVIEMVYVTSSSWRTPSGLHVGSPEDDVRDALGDQIDAVPHHDGSPGDWNLAFVPQDPNDPNTVVFESFGGLVYQIKVGDQQVTRLKEGCA